MTIVVRKLEESEAGLANDFFNTIYKTNRSIENFHWEFFSGPAGPAVYIVAVDDAHAHGVKIVGIQCAIPIELRNINGDVLMSAKSEDTLVDPQYRGQKIFERMYALLFDECRKIGIRYIWGFTPAKKAFERIGFRVPFQAHQALIVFKPRKAFEYLSSLNPENKTRDNLKIAGLVTLSRVYSAFRTSQPSAELTVKQVEFGDRQDMFRKLWSDTRVYFLRMHERYIRWRIADNPFENGYENYHFFSADELVADVIINIRSGGLGYIEQLVFASQAPDHLRKQVLLHVIRMMMSRTKLIRALCFDTNEELRRQEKLLNDVGFFTLKRGAHFVWKAVDGGSLDPADLFLTRLFTQGNQ